MCSMCFLCYMCLMWCMWLGLWIIVLSYVLSHKIWKNTSNSFHIFMKKIHFNQTKQRHSSLLWENCAAFLLTNCNERLRYICFEGNVSILLIGQEASRSMQDSKTLKIIPEQDWTWFGWNGLTWRQAGVLERDRPIKLWDLAWNFILLIAPCNQYRYSTRNFKCDLRASTILQI